MADRAVFHRHWRRDGFDLSAELMMRSGQRAAIGERARGVVGRRGMDDIEPRTCLAGDEPGQCETGDGAPQGFH